MADYTYSVDDRPWMRCYDCKRSFTERAYRIHIAKDHVDRPYPDAMTIAEVGKALGWSISKVNYSVTNGRLRAIDLQRGVVKRWVRKNALVEFVRERVEADPRLAVKWADTGMLAK